MFDALHDFSPRLDGWIIAAGCLCAVSASLLGNFLVLRRMSMLGDAITHAILPGLAVAYLVSGARDSMIMFLGAALVGVLTAVFSEWIRGFGKVEEGAAMGVVFTTLFAIGLIMIVQAADHVELDPSCVLYGSIELTPLDQVAFMGIEVPRVVIVLSITLVINALFVAMFYKELKISSFDPSLSTTLGFRSQLMHYLLMTLVAVTAVASFESIGNILVVAMFIVPPAAAYMLTDRLSVMIGLSCVLAIAAAVIGHLSALVVPSWAGFRSANTSGMMAVVAGGIFLSAALLGPRHGVLVKATRLRLLGLRILAEDILAVMFRFDEQAGGTGSTKQQLEEFLLAGSLSTEIVLRVHVYRGNMEKDGESYRLTDYGKLRARWLVRSHRLWEKYLVDEVGMDSERIHDKAHALEHITDASLREKLVQETTDPGIDPHGAPIPPESE